VAERYADREATEKELDAARDVSWTAETAAAASATVKAFPVEFVR